MAPDAPAFLNTNPSTNNPTAEQQQRTNQSSWFVGWCCSAVGLFVNVLVFKKAGTSGVMLTWLWCWLLMTGVQIPERSQHVQQRIISLFVLLGINLNEHELNICLPSHTTTKNKICLRLSSTFANLWHAYAIWNFSNLHCVLGNLTWIWIGK